MYSAAARDAGEAMPVALHGFEHVQRYWDPGIERWMAKILPGEYYVTQAAEAITTVLGSCVSACIRDPQVGCGGMNHFMLPEDCEGSSGSWNQLDNGASTRFGSYAMERLINELLKLGARRERLEVKVFGGGRILPSMTDVGKRNVSFALSFLKLEGLNIAAQDLGGVYPRRIVYLPGTGQVLLKHLRAIEGRVVAESDSRYRARLAASNAGAVELFT